MTDIDLVLSRGVDEVIVEKSLKKKLKSKKKLIVKLGIDPTGASLHLGHGVVLRKLRQLQDLGHQVVLVIGDFTALIGDPSGRSFSRKALTPKEIEKNMKSYIDQAGKILDVKKAQFKYNSSWLSKMDLSSLMELTSKATLAQIYERKDFRSRIKEGDDVSYLETLYPLLQGYDSVMLKADIELGGTDQKFNLLMGRQIQKRYQQKQQDIITMKLLLGTDGNKMSKSADNFISLNSGHIDMYGKIMSISDDLIKHYFELCTSLSLDQIDLKKPYQEKKRLAQEIVSLYYGKDQARQAANNFEQVFSKGDYSQATIDISIKPNTHTKVKHLPLLAKATTSTVQAKKLVFQKAIELNGKKLLDPNQEIVLQKGDIIKIGKRRILKVK